MAVTYGSLPFDEQIDFFRRKLNLETRAWTDVYTAEHDHAFMVAGAMKRALLEDLRAAVEKAITQGTTIDEFRKDFDSIVQKHGWAYKGGRGWRTRVIYDTNVRQSYNAGRVAQMKHDDVVMRRPYWRYRHNDSVAHPRDAHVKLNGLILRHDDLFWQTHTPSNGWGCKCYIETLAERDMKKLGKAGPDQAPPIEYETQVIGKNGPSPREVTVPVGIDPGFEYQPGESWLKAMTRGPKEPPPFDHIPTGGQFVAADPLPSPRRLADPAWPDKLNDEDAVARFLSLFDATLDQPQVFTDVAGEPLVISKDLFIRKTKTGDQWKVGKNNRDMFLPLLAETIKQPDEVWVRIEWHHQQKAAVLRKRYIALFDIGDEHKSGLAVFEEGSDGWWGVTTFDPADGNYGQHMEGIRNGVRIYRRE